LRPEKVWFVYLIQCADRSLYCGISTDVGKRLAAHNLGKGAKYTRSRTPVELLATSSALTRSDALKLEYRIKKMPAGSKRTILEKQTAEDQRLS
jgi:putative endonuclease